MYREYDAAGQLIAMVDANDHRTEYENDAAGRLWLTRDALGSRFLGSLVWPWADRALMPAEGHRRGSLNGYDEDAPLLGVGVLGGVGERNLETHEG